MKTESTVIRLPTDKSRLCQLRMKLAEYEKRYADFCAQHPNRAPAQTRSTSPGFKFRILRDLFASGEINTWHLSRKYADEDGFANPLDFDRACGVIEDYCTTGGKNVLGGTGLVTVQ